MPLNQLMYLSIRRESIELIKLFIHGCVAANEGKLLSLLRGQLPECATCRFMPKPAFVQDIEDISWLRTCWCCSRYVSFKLKIILLGHLLGCLPYVIEIVSYFWRVAWVPNFALNMPSLHVVSLSLSCVCVSENFQKETECETIVWAFWSRDEVCVLKFVVHRRNNVAWSPWTLNDTLHISYLHNKLPPAFNNFFTPY